MAADDALEDDFDDIFFDEAGVDENQVEKNNCATKSKAGAGSTKNSEKTDDDAISIGSSSSSSSDDSSSDSSSSSSSSDEEEDGSIESCVKEKRKKSRCHAAATAAAKDSGRRVGKVDARAAIRSPPMKNVYAAEASSASNANISRNNSAAARGDGNDDDAFDDDLDDDDLAEFFSQSPKPQTNTAPKRQEEAKYYEEESDEDPVADAAAQNDHNFDSLDDDEDAWADLEENDSVRGGGIASGSSANHQSEGNNMAASGESVDKEEDTGGSSSADKRDFTISYNCEKKSSPVIEELLESSDDEDGKCLGGGNKNKENASPNKPRATSSYGQKESEDDFLELLSNDNNSSSPMKSPAKEAPDSPSSPLLTPREEPSSPSASSLPPPRSIAFESAKKGKTPGTARKPSNPYQKQQKQHISPAKQRMTKTDVHQHDSSRSDASSKNNSDNQEEDAPSGVVALPDIGLSPDAQQTELQRLGISHSHYKPPPYQPSPEPIVHKLDTSNRPQHTRRNIDVDKIFSAPVKNLWRGKFTKFNHVQSEMANVLANSDDNVIVSAPTGAGKTALFEMAMARLFASNLINDGKRQVVSKSCKVVYLAPNKALCEERQSDWSQRLRHIDPSIITTTITGDVNSTSSYLEIANAHLILTTPEKWDSITRKWNDQFVLLACIKLLLVDEVHMIGEPGRGGCLESVIMRMKTIQRAACAKTLTSSEIGSSSYNNTTPEALTSNMRIVAVSATLPNLGQLASFVESGEAYVFDQSYRPVPLNIYVQACGHIGSNRYLFDKSLNQHVSGILKRFSNGRPAIVFCHTKKETEVLADELAKSYVNPSRINDPALLNFASKTDTAAMQRCLRRGIAFHHAGVDPSDRRLVEEAFGSGSISCLCATSTLAMGVNLPSHLVVIKGTSAYRGSELGHQDIDSGTLLQMMGRAGRPGFDKTGTAVIMTDSLSKRRYENISQGLKVVESHLMGDDKLTEVLNIEISQGVITSAEEAVDWVKGTFLYRRIQSHPLFYGFSEKCDGSLHTFIADKCSTSIEKLSKIQAINVAEDGTFSPAAGCHVMSRNFVDFETMKAIVKLPHDSGPVQLLHMMANCAKIQTQVRRLEKKNLNEAYKMIKYKLEGPQSKIRIQSPDEKVFVMLQASIGQHLFPDQGLIRQMSDMMDKASQILSAIEQYSKEGSFNGQVATQGMLFRRSLYSSLWGDKDGVLNQIGGVTQEMAAKLKEVGISTFADAVNSSDEDIARGCMVTLSFANCLRAAASKILQRTLKLSACSKEKDNGGLELYVKLERRVARGAEETSERVVSYTLLIFTDREGGLLHYSEDISNETELRVKCPEKFGRAYIRLVSNLVGLDEQVTIEGNDKIQKSAFSLTPTAAKKSSTKGNKQAKQPPSTAPVTARKRLFDTHQNSVSNVSDLRLHKRGKVQKEQDGDDDDCIIVDEEAVEYVSTEPSKVAPKKSRSEKFVTPSPHPRTKHQNSKTLTPMRNGTASSAPRTEKSNRPVSQYSSGRHSNNSTWSKNGSSNRKGARNARSSWKQDKWQQKRNQETAFNSPKDNVFQSFTYDPNNIENSLNSNAASFKQAEQEESIIPNSVPTSAFSTRKPRYGDRLRTPATNRRKTTAASNRISSVGLLQQKAAELQHHHSQATTSRSYVNRAPVQHNTMAAPSVQHDMGYPPNDANMMNQHGGSVHEHNQFMGSAHEQNQFRGQASAMSPFFQQRPGTAAGSVMPQQSFGILQRPGTSAGSVMPQQSIGMASQPSLTPPPPFMGRGMAQNQFTQGPMAGVARPMSSAGQSLASRLRNNMLSQQQRFPAQQSFGFQPQNRLQPQHSFQQPMQDSMSLYQNHPGFQHDMAQQQQQQQQFDDTFNDELNDPICQGLDPSYGHVENECMNNFEAPFLGPTYGNMMTQPQLQTAETYQFGVGHQIEGGQAAVHNPYQPTQQHYEVTSNPYNQQSQQQQGLRTNPQQSQKSAPLNPYNQQHQQQNCLPNPYKQPQQQQNFEHNDGMPANDTRPMHEVVVQSSSTQEEAAGDDVSQFDDAFL